MRTRWIVRAGLWAACLVLGAQPGDAQSSELPQVPEGLAADVRSMLGTRREELISEEARFRAIYAEHSAQCRQVSAQSPQVAACTARRDSLRSAAAKLQQDKDRFSNAVAELNRLITEEAALSQAIRAGVERMRAMLDDATEAGQEQLNLLSEEIKRQLAERQRFRVRHRPTAVAGVRG